jgi:signal transduction histidine kinase
MIPRPGFKTSGPAYLPGLVLILALGILGLTAWQSYHHLSKVILTQMENRDGEILNAVALSDQYGIKATNLVERLQDPAEQLALTLKISQLKDGVLGVRLFDPHGNFVTAFPPDFTSDTLSAGKLSELRQLHPVSHYEESGRLRDLFLMDPTAFQNDTNNLPLMEVNIPLHAPGDTQLLACAQLWMDAHDFAAQSARMEDQLRRQALGIFLLGSLLLTIALSWAYYRLQKAGFIIQERTTRLLEANNELMLATKTGALGAVTAHLIHGLSNPLANVEHFITTHTVRAESAGDWDEARRETQHMRQLVQEVVRVLGEFDKTDAYEISLAELAKLLDGKIQPAARELGVRCETKLMAQGKIPNQPANIVLLILENLVSNALQVTPRNKSVHVSFTLGDHEVVCQVSDEGTGFPEHRLKNLFSPCRSTKGGAGLGLAISKQLANQFGARLELRQSTPRGSELELILPKAIFTDIRTLDASAS